MGTYIFVVIISPTCSLEDVLEVEHLLPGEGDEGQDEQGLPTSLDYSLHSAQ